MQTNVIILLCRKQTESKHRVACILSPMGNILHKSLNRDVGETKDEKTTQKANFPRSFSISVYFLKPLSEMFCRLFQRCPLQDKPRSKRTFMWFTCSDHAADKHVRIVTIVFESLRVWELRVVDFLIEQGRRGSGVFPTCRLSTTTSFAA